MTSQTVWTYFRARDTLLSVSQSDNQSDSQTGLWSAYLRFQGLNHNGPGQTWESNQRLQCRCITSFRCWDHGYHGEGSSLSMSLAVCVSGQRLSHPFEDEQNHPEPPAALCEYYEYYYCYWCCYTTTGSISICSTYITDTSSLFPLPVSFPIWSRHHKGLLWCFFNVLSTNIISLS